MATAPDESAPVRIVGLGASAGGLQSLERLFDKMPADTGLAFIIIQHLSPDFKSLMEDLLARRTAMTVQWAEEGMRVRANAIYLIPPRAELTLHERRLHLTAREVRPHLDLLIDVFLRSLASEERDRAAAIILSGTGIDGSRGAMLVDGAGGLVIVQDPESAQFDGMPKATLATGCADLVLLPEEMPAALLDWLRHPQLPPGHPATADAPDGAAGEEDRIFQLLRKAYGVDFLKYKRGTIGRRVARRMGLRNLARREDYLALLAGEADELEALYHDLLIGVTEFFRDGEAFAALARKVLPGLFAKVSEEDGLRAWVAGCATGEEAYSLAMLLTEFAEETGYAGRISIFATDLHQSSLQTASAGLYPPERLGALSAARQARFLTADGRGRLKVNAALRKLIVFAPHNVITDPPFTRLDLVTCRNLLIYIEPETQHRVISLFHFALRPGGALFLGGSESVGRMATEFETVDAHWKLFRKLRDVPLPADAHPNLGAAERPAPVAPAVTARGHAPIDRQLLHDYDWLLKRYAPPGVLLDAQGSVLHYFGDVHRFLRVREGRADSGFANLVDGDLRLAVSTALQRAAAADTTVSIRHVHRRLGDPADEVVDVSVEPVADSRAAARHFHVALFARPTAAAATAEPGPERPFAAEETSRQRIRELEGELAGLREHLQRTVEELQTSNGELQSTNEELLTANEELRSTNEELHSVNEELYTVNSELERKNTELKSLNDDHENLLRCVSFALLFLDRTLRIRRFNPAIAEFFDLLPQDVGRPIEHIAYHLEERRLILLDSCRAVLREEKSIEREILGREGRWFLKRLLPFRVEGGRVDGVIVTFTDITMIKSAERAFHEYRERFLAAARVSFDPFLLLRVHRDGTGEVVDFAFEEVNAPGEKFLDCPRDQLLGRLLGDVLPDNRTDPRFIPEYRKVFETGLPMIREFSFTDARGQTQWMRQQVIRVGEGIAMTLADTTRQHQFQEALYLRDRAIDEAPVGIFIAEARSPAPAIVYVNRAYTRITGFTLDESIGRQGRFLQGDEHEQPGLMRLREAMDKGLSCTVVLRNFRKDGTPFWSELSIGPVRDEQGQLTHFIGTQTDVTERRKELAEKERFERKIQEAQKLESLGLLAGGIAHDFNNLLTTILCNANVIRLDLREGKSATGGIDQIDIACKQGSALCRQLLAYSGKGKFMIEHLDLRRDAEETVRLVRSTLRRDTLLELALDEGLPLVKGDATQIRQVLLNLLLNAHDATAGRPGVIRLELATVEADARFLSGHTVDLPAGRYVQMLVRDNGSGMPPEVRARMFEPFFTTKEHGHGLGMAAVLGIVRGHHGAIWIDSTPGKGTTIGVLLPTVHAEGELRAAAATPTTRVRPGIIVTDDEPLIRHAAGQMLSKLGYHVFPAEDGEQCLRAYRENRDRVSVVLLDLRMPGLDGRETLARLQESNPDLPVVMMSGFFKEEAVDKTTSSRRVTFLHKPFDLQGLKDKLEQVLTAPAGAR